MNLVSQEVYYTISNIKSVLDELDTSLFKDFIKIMVFDALIGKQDRHEENWGITEKDGNYLIQLENLKKQTNQNVDIKVAKALVAAQETTDKMKELAKAEAELIVKEAKDNASAIVQEALINAQKTEQEYELLKKKLADEGLFDAGRKRGIPKDLTKIGVISSTAAAGYSDFIKIINARWGGLKIQVAHTQYQKQ